MLLPGTLPATQTLTTQSPPPPPPPQSLCRRVQLKSALRSGPNANVQDGNGNSPLHHAIEIGNKQAVVLLLNAGARYGNFKSFLNHFPLFLLVLARYTPHTPCTMLYSVSVLIGC